MGINWPNGTAHGLVDGLEAVVFRHRFYMGKNNYAIEVGHEVITGMA